ncbi:hypothetical protein [Streptomyces murinus]|uniref:hypothetical protein n=1 Tax=Streptomyces murinus TaxID=33900 RepID=UPI002E0EFAA6|nr:hypothetical protein OG516_19260 [Streptomyces murinus]
MSRVRIAAAAALLALAALITPAAHHAQGAASHEQAGDIGWGVVTPAATAPPETAAAADIGWG